VDDKQEHQATKASQKSIQDSIAYNRRLYANVLEWYKIADTKAQLLLALNGVFVAALAGGLLLKPADVAQAKIFGGWTWLCLGVLAFSVTASTFSAARCVASRLSDARVKYRLSEFGVDSMDAGTYRPETAWWFGYIATLHPNEITTYLRAASPEFERDAITSAVVQLAPNVLAKHRWVNRGWWFASLALVSLLASIVTVAFRNI
jgi:hypothetical protein